MEIRHLRSKWIKGNYDYSKQYIRNSLDPDIAGSYYAMQRAGQAAIDLAIQTNTAIVTMIDGKIVRIPAAELIKQRQLTP
jgi:hypothetical protein